MLDRRRITVTLGAAALAACGLVAVAPQPAHAATVIGCDRASERITVTASARLDPSCTYTAGLDIRSSHVVLDCQGALIQPTDATIGGIGIDVATPADVDLFDVTIRHCRVDGFLNSMHVRRERFNTLPRGHEYDHRLSNVVIEDNELSNSRGVGIYVDGYVSRTTIRRNVIHDAGSTGVYLDTGSRFTTVRDNVLVHNGWIENGPGGTNSTFAGLNVRSWGPGREGIAVDGAHDNEIAHNLLLDNAAGGVFLYTNCGENVHTDPGSWVEHRYGAEHNVVEQNLITGGQEGVWVGSRMGENVYPMDCSDVPYVAGPFQAITLDRAARNTVRDNTITGATFGMRVEDNFTTIERNHFVDTDPTHYAIVVGTPYRTTVLHRPVAHTALAGNVADITGNASPYRWVDGVTDLRATGNVANGVPSSLCAAPDIPRSFFVMTYAWALQDPNAPPVDPPPYDVPSLGALSPCSSATIAAP